MTTGAESDAHAIAEASPDARVASRDPFLRRLRRRIITIPAIFVALAMVTAALPALLVAALLVDLARGVRRRRLVSLRLVLFLEAFLCTETFGLALLGLVWLSTIGSPTRRAARTWPVQRFYTGILMSFVKSLFALRFEAEDEELAAEPGPVLVFVRHASIVDVLIPAHFVANRHRIELRYVLKRELLMEPCIDVAGHFIPNHFVARDGKGSQREIDAVRALKAGIDARSGVLVYPEGTRFTQKKRAHAIARLADDPAARARAERLRHLLPIRPGGALALLDAPPACDVLFIAHSGLEGFSSVADVWSGALVGRAIRLKFWRERAPEIPRDRDAQRAWLEDRWQRLDDWLASQGEGRSDPPAGEGTMPADPR